jgi:hypothetical protein
MRRDGHEVTRTVTALDATVGRQVALGAPLFEVEPT